METTLVKVFEYGNNPVGFRMGNDFIMVNATAMARPFGNSKRAQFWLNNRYTGEFMAALSKARNLALTDLVQVTKGGNNAGTWLHEDAAIEFARWLSPGFALWCNDRIRELVQYGITVTPEMRLQAVANPSFVLDMLEKIRDGYRDSIIYRLENGRLLEKLEAQTCKVEFYDNVHRNRQKQEEHTIYRISQIATELGMTGMQLNRILQEKGIQRRKGCLWILTGEYEGRGYTRKRTFLKGFDEDGEPLYCTFTVWTSKGRKFIIGLFEGKEEKV